MTDRPPSGCRYCGHPECGHGNRWHESVHWHVWHPPTDAQTKQRMLARRADRITARAARYEVQPPSLRDQIAEVLYRHTMDHAAGGPARLLTRDETVLWENSLARADAVMAVVEAETAALRQRAEELDAELRAVKIDRDEWCNRAHYWRATAGPPEGSEEYDLDTDPDALRRALAEVIDLMECRPARMIHDAVWARVRPVLRIHREKLAEERQRAETAERQHAQALDQIATERRGKLAAEAAVRRSREALARFNGRGVITPDGTDWNIPTAAEVLDAWRAALDAEQPKETP